MSERNVSPRPLEGRRWRFERNDAYTMTVRYNGRWQWWAYLTGRRFKAKWGVWWFASFDLGWLHGYAGHRPINLEDPNFDVPEGFDRKAPATEFAIRFGIGEWDE